MGMKIEALHVENLLSFDTYDLRFDDSLTVLVGPNGAGKTNVVRMLDLMATALAWADERFVPGTAMPVVEQVLDSYAGARHEGASTTTPARVRLTLALTTQGELDRVVAFVQAGLLSTLLGELSGSGASGQLAAWVSSEVTAEKLAPMWRGALVLEHSGVPDASWEIAYEFRDGTRRTVGLSPAAAPPDGSSGPTSPEVSPPHFARVGSSSDCSASPSPPMSR